MNLENEINKYITFTASLIDSMALSMNGEDILQYSSYEVYMRKYNSLIEELIRCKIIENIGLLDYYNLEKLPSKFDTIPMQQKGYFESVYTNLKILKNLLENMMGIKKNKVLEIKDFFKANLRKAVFNLPEKEIEIQNIMEQLLIGKGFEKGIHYDRETGRIKISIKEVIPDFIFPKLGLALEVKLSKTTTKSKAIVDEINADILAYSKEYNSILFLVYDLGSIRDIDEFKNDLESYDNVSIIVIKH